MGCLRIKIKIGVKMLLEGLVVVGVLLGRAGSRHTRDLCTVATATSDMECSCASGTLSRQRQ